MAVVIIDDGGLVTKPAGDERTYEFDWDTNLAPAAVIINNTFVLTPVKPSRTDAVLVKDNEALIPGGRRTRVRLKVGTFGQLYKIANSVKSSEDPNQTKTKHFFLAIE